MIKYGDRVVWNKYAGEVTVVRETEVKVIFDDGDGPDYWYYAKDELKIMMTNEQKQKIENSFTYHKPEGDQPQRYEDLRDTAKQLAFKIIENTPQSREQSLAITKLEEAIMWANKAIACNE